MTLVRLSLVQLCVKRKRVFYFALRKHHDKEELSPWQKNIPPHHAPPEKEKNSQLVARQTEPRPLRNTHLTQNELPPSFAFPSLQICRLTVPLRLGGHSRQETLHKS